MTVVWVLAAAVLITLIVAWSVHWTRYPERARGHAANPVMAQFWGAPAIALMTVGTGTLVLGGGLLGPAAAVSADWVLWLAGTAITVRTARRGLPFALTWWSFTFPVGTCVTGTVALAGRSGADALRAASVLLFALLVTAWLVVAARTVAGSATGRLFKPA